MNKIGSYNGPSRKPVVTLKLVCALTSAETFPTSSLQTTTDTFAFHGSGCGLTLGIFKTCQESKNMQPRLSSQRRMCHIIVEHLWGREGRQLCSFQLRGCRKHLGQMQGAETIISFIHSTNTYLSARPYSQQEGKSLLSLQSYRKAGNKQEIF